MKCYRSRQNLSPTTSPDKVTKLTRKERGLVLLKLIFYYGVLSYAPVIKLTSKQKTLWATHKGQHH